MATLRRARQFVLRDEGEVTARSAAPADARAVRALLDAVAAEPSTPILHVPGSCSVRGMRAEIFEAAAAADRITLVAVVDAEVAGHLVLAGVGHPFSPHVCEVGLAVAAAQRRLGVASALLDVALVWAAQRPFRRVLAAVFPHNEAALRFFGAHGFVREGERSEQYRRDGRYFGEVLLARRLAPGEAGGRQ
jgi:L-phenylalanine/L-methionine N-acetyltransferase